MVCVAKHYGRLAQLVLQVALLMMSISAPSVRTEHCANPPLKVFGWYRSSQTSNPPHTFISGFLHTLISLRPRPFSTPWILARSSSGCSATATGSLSHTVILIRFRVTRFGSEPKIVPPPPPQNFPRAKR
eukprot:1437786-Amphidinium_carterae.1